MRKAGALFILFLLVIGILIIAQPASANIADNLAIDCQSWSVSFRDFNANDRDLLITVNGLEVSFEADPPDGEFNRSGSAPTGLSGSVTLAIFWTHRQAQVEGPTLTVQLDCQTTTTADVSNTTITTPEVTTTTAACPEGLIHQPPMCIPPTTPEPTVPTPTTTPITTTTIAPPPDSLPFTGVDPRILALGSVGFFVIGWVILTFVKREMS